MQYTVIKAAWPFDIVNYLLQHWCEYEYIIADLFHSTVDISGKMPITVLAQSTSVKVTIYGSGEMYSCTLNNQTVNITSGQTVQLTGLAPNTNYTINCYSVNDNSCLEAKETFITGTVLLRTLVIRN